MLWACIALPSLALDVARRAQPDPERPLALIDGPASGHALLAVNEAASRLGLQCGQKLTVARAILPDFTALAYASVDTARWQQWLAAWAYRFSHQVCADWPDSIVLEVGQSLTLMRGWPMLEHQLRDELQQLQFAHRIALAPTPRAAHLLAWVKDGVQAHDMAALQRLLAQIPVRRAGLPDHAGERLHRLGLRRLQQVIDLPADAVRRRFGVALVQYLQELQGQRPSLMHWYAPPDHFDMRLPFDHGVSSLQALRFPLRRLVMDLAAFLRARSQGVQQVRLMLEHDPDDVPPGTSSETSLELNLLAPEQDAVALSDLLHSRLEPVQLTHPVHALRLMVRRMVALRPAMHDLFEPRTQQDTEPWSRLRERLRVRLGEASVYQVRPVADPRPEHAWQRVTGIAGQGRPGNEAKSEGHEIQRLQGKPWHAGNERDAGSQSGIRGQVGAGGQGRQGTSQRQGDQGEQGYFLRSVKVQPDRPGWMLPAPLPLTLPVRAILRGPERLESGWWDGDDQKRDYYVLHLANGQCAWAFVPVGQQGPWMLHGWFA